MRDAQSTASQPRIPPGMIKRCPACHGDQFTVLDHIPVAHVVAAYRQAHLAVDISGLMAGQGDKIELLACPRCDLRWYWPMVAGDEPFYEQLQRHDWYYQADKPEHRHAAALVQGGQSVLEVGCGAGAFAACLPAAATYRGLEFNQAAVARARAKGLDVTQCSMDVEAASHPGAYDVVCHFQVLEHVPDVAGFMRDCVKALRPGGLMVVTVPAEDSFLRLSGAAWLNMPPHHVTRWTDLALQNLFASLGLQAPALWHEPVAEYHVDWYRSVLAEQGLRQFLGGRAGLAGGGLAARLAYRAAPWKRLQSWLVARGESGFGFKGRGHSVTAVGRLLPH